MIFIVLYVVLVLCEGKFGVELCDVCFWWVCECVIEIVEVEYIGEVVCYCIELFYDFVEYCCVDEIVV